MVSPAPHATAEQKRLPTLVTGCSSGIGRAIAVKLASAGGPLYASARNIESIEDLREYGCQLLELDVTNPADRKNAIERIESDHGSVGALVNNAGFGQQGPLEETPLDAIRTQFETNVYGPIGLCQLALPGMRRAGHGRIVNLSSMGGRLSFPGGGAYHGSKYALEAMSDVLRFEVGGFGIKVIVVEPGPTASAFGTASIESLSGLTLSDDDAYAEFKNGIRAALESTFSSPPEGSTTPEAVAEAVWRALADEDPEPRMIVGQMAEQLIELKNVSSDAGWDVVVSGMYPQPGPLTREP
jgi:NAD(P)-dependent dehydrogenase (short-subunit alcohol dehydrogenase family)